jgi:hypothetical protein
VLSAPGAVSASPAGTLPNSTVLNCTGPIYAAPNCTGPNCTGQSPSGSPPLSRGLRAPGLWPVSRRPPGRRNSSAPIPGKSGRLPSGPSGPFLSHRLTELPGSQLSAPEVTVLRSPGHRALLSGSPCSAPRIRCSAPRVTVPISSEPPRRSRLHRAARAGELPAHPARCNGVRAGAGRSGDGGVRLRRTGNTFAPPGGWMG